MRQHPRERITWLKSAILAARRLKDRTVETIHLNGLGVAYFHLGDFHNSIESYDQSLRLAREKEDLFSESVAVGGLGLAYIYKNEYRRAIVFLERQLAISRKIENRVNEGVALEELGRILQVIKQAEETLDILREFKDPNVTTVQK